MERIRSRIVEEIVSAVLTVIYHISCVFLFVPRAAIKLAQRLYISFFGINLKNKVIITTTRVESLGCYYCTSLTPPLTARTPQVVLITGATSAIGRSIAHDLFRSDCRLILCARNEHELEQLKSELISAARNGIQSLR